MTSTKDMNRSAEFAEQAEAYADIMHALYGDYVNVYFIDPDSFSFEAHHQSEVFKNLKLPESGPDFFEMISDDFIKHVYVDDKGYVSNMLRRETLIQGLEGNDHVFICRLSIDDEQRYYRIKAIRKTDVNKEIILLGIRDIDEQMSREKTILRNMETMLNKEKLYINAILASADGCLEVNLSKNELHQVYPDADTIKDSKISRAFARTIKHFKRYDDFVSYLSKIIVNSNEDDFIESTKASSLIDQYYMDNRRLLKSFKVKFLEDPDSRYAECEVREIDEVIYISQDNQSGDIIALIVFFDMTERNEQTLKMESLVETLRLTRIRNFSSQMQPHFLYNALASIREVVLQDPAYAYEMLGAFTVHLRGCIRAMANDDLIPFTQEIENIKAYVNIEKMRFSDKLSVIYDLEATNFSVIPLSVQPLVENAIRHGIYERGPSGGTVSLRSMETLESWIIEVEDDGVGFDKNILNENNNSNEDSYGLQNLIFRLNAVMNAKVSIHSELGVGTKVSVELPKIRSNAYEMYSCR